jgi:hypothetical protein
MLPHKPIPSILKTQNSPLKVGVKKHCKFSNSQDYNLKLYFTVACRKGSRICTTKVAFSKGKTFLFVSKFY